MLDLDADSRISLEAILTDGDVKRALQTPNERKKRGNVMYYVLTATE